MARYPSNGEHGATNLVALVLHYRAKHAAQDAALLALATALDEKLAQLKNELLGGADIDTSKFITRDEYDAGFDGGQI